MDFPKTFTDSKGRSWTCEIGLPVSRRIKDVAGVTIEELAPELDPKKKPKEEHVLPISNFIGDPFKVFDVFYAIVKPAADKLGLTKEQVEEGMDTEVAQTSMALAVLRAIHDFFRFNPKRIWFIRLVATKAEELMRNQQRILQREIDKIDIGKVLDEALANGAASSSADASSGGNPGTPDGSSPNAIDSAAS